MYEVACMGKNELDFSRDPLQHKQTVLTKPYQLQLSHGKVRWGSITAKIHSNLDLPLHCILLDLNKTELERLAVSGHDRSLSFSRVNQDLEYVIQCSVQLDSQSGRFWSPCLLFMIAWQFIHCVCND